MKKLVLRWPIIEGLIDIAAAFYAGVIVSMIMLILLNGCATIQPGNDRLVVTAERMETVAISSFDLVVNIDNANRPFWRTNLPAFHEFAEWLRQPQIVWQTNSLPRGAAMVANVNNIKNDYKASKVDSNVLVSAIAVLQSAMGQANGWLSLVTNSPVIQLEKPH